MEISCCWSRQVKYPRTLKVIDKRAHDRIPGEEGKMSFDTIFLLSMVPIELVLRKIFNDGERSGSHFADYGLKFTVYRVLQGRVNALLTGHP